MRIALNDMVRSPAQMRTRFDTEKLAELTLQMYARGWDEDRPPLVRKVNGDFEIVRGHRRRMCYLMAQFLREQYPEESVEDGGVSLSIDVAKETWEMMIEEAGGALEAKEQLIEMYGDTEVAAVLFEGSEAEAVLALQGDNMGDEEPDPLGIAHSLHYGQKLGISLAQAAANMGKDRKWAEQYAALAQIDQEIAQRAADGQISIRIGLLLMSLPAEKREAASRLVKETDPRLLRITTMDDVVDRLKGWGGISVPLTFRNQRERNIARAMSNAWQEKVEESPVEAYYAVAALTYKGQFDDPWKSSMALDRWLNALGVGDPSHSWGRRLMPYLHTVSCETCPVAQLPDETLTVDLRLPCRAGLDVDRCMFGLAPDDEFDVEVPMNWANNAAEYIAVEDGTYRARSFEELQAAWEAQKEAEEEQARKERERKERLQQRTSTTSTTSIGGGQDAADTAEPEEPEGPTETDLYRDEIRLYMETHEQFDTEHVLATPCDRCKHRLDSSPVSSRDDVPHCAWADRKRVAKYHAYEAEGNDMTLPVCQQFAPSEPWADIIPEHPAPPDLPREYIVAQIKKAVKESHRITYNFMGMLFLTGRPMRSSGSYTDWFYKRFDECLGDLSDGQLFTLWLLAMGERDRNAAKRSRDDDESFWTIGRNPGQMIRLRQVRDYESVLSQSEED